jgi:hypothetical protein
MIERFIKSIIGGPADGRRKMGIGIYTIALLSLLAGAAEIGVWLASDTMVSQLFQGIANQCVTAISAAFGILMALNGWEHHAKRKTEG